MINIIPSDQPARDKVIFDVERTLAVFAGAGTGKTTLLVDRYLSLLRKKDVSPKQIVAITFTIKAAGELRKRVLDKLVENDLGHLTSVVETSPIGTIHSFCSTLLRQYAVEAGLDPQFSIISELEHRTFLQEVFHAWLNRSLGQDALSFKLARASGFGLQQIKKLALKLYDYRDLIDRIHIDDHAFEKSDVLELMSGLKLLQDFATQHCDNQEDEGFIQVHKLGKMLQGLQDQKLEDAGLKLLRIDLPAKKGTQKNWDSKASLEAFKIDYTSFKEHFEKVQRSFARQIFADLLAWLKGYVEHIQMEKQNRSVMDFSDLLFFTRDLLRTNVEVRNQLQEQYKYFLIDEFQDTDPMQAEIFWMLARNEVKYDKTKAWHEQSLIPGKMFTVGDLNQSIYRFRDASVETYRQCIANIESQGELLYILQNFRSHPRIIDAVNRYFTTLLQENFKPLSSLPAESFVDAPAVQVLTFPREEKQRSDQARSKEAFAIARHIRRLIDAETQIKDPITKTYRKVGFQDMALLFPALTSLSVYERAFRENNIPFTIHKGGSFFDTPEIHSVVLTLKALLHPFDNLAVASALASEWFGCSLDDLVKIRKQNGSFDYRKADLQNDVWNSAHIALEILQTLQKEVLQLTPVGFLNRFHQLTFAPIHADFRINKEQVKENLNKLTWLAHDFENSHGYSITAFHQWLTHLSQNSRETTEAMPLTNASAIQLMTIHQSKGLEFPVVFLTNFVSKIQDTSQVYANRFEQKLEVRIGDKDTYFKTSGFDALAEKEKALLLEEKKRLMYVATTRARDLLIVPATTEEDKGYQQLLEPLMQQIEHFEIFQNMDENPVPNQIHLSIQKQPQAIDTEFLTQIRKGYSRTTATDQKEKPHDSNSTTQSNFARPKLGLAFHAYVERSNSNLLNRELIHQIAAEHNLEIQKQELEQLVTTFLSSDLHKRIRSAKRVLKEVPFSYFDQDMLIEGYIDLLMEEQNGWTIVDLKTDQILQSQLQQRSAFYTHQLDIYEQSLKALSIPIRQKILYFVRLDVSIEVGAMI